MVNRIKEFISDDDVADSDTNDPHVICVIVSDDIRDRIILSHKGNKLLWYWVNHPNGSCGLVPSGSEDMLFIHPLAAEAFVEQQVFEYCKLEGIDKSQVLYVNSRGEALDGIIMSPEQLGKMTFDVVFKKEKIKELYDNYLDSSSSLNEELIGEAIAFGVLKPLLSLVNLE